MPSSPWMGASSPPLGRGEADRRSRFTYRQLAHMASYSTSNPLRVVAHIDLDAFYAQCEMVRLGVSKDQPLAVQQWQGLIAVNYPAREFGINRHLNVTEAKKLCPDLIAQHVATWRAGEDKWAYREDSAANIASDKVSLDPYRLQSRAILALVKETLPKDLQKVEKASIDEVFLDLSAQIHSKLLERYPELNNPPPYDDPTERLPLPSVAALNWQADALVDLDEEQESVDPDWDDVAILLGSEIVRDIRAQVLEKLGFTCSAGIAQNKLVSKLGSGFKKPNQQTVVRSRAVLDFLSGFKLTKMRNLGGKLGGQVVSTFNTESVDELRDVSLDQLKLKLGEETGLWLYNTIRGIDHSEVSSRTQIKSMLSAKSFRPTINSAQQAIGWLRIFVGDIFSRLVEEGVLENKRRPRTINLHHRWSGQTRSRQGPIPQGKSLDEGLLLELAMDLLGQIIAEGNVWPCANLSLSVGGFEEGVKGNMGIDTFLLKGEEAEAARSKTPESRPASTGLDRQTKRKRAQEDGIHRFFGKPSAARDRKGLDTDSTNASPALESEGSRETIGDAIGKDGHGKGSDGRQQSIGEASWEHQTEGGDTMRVEGHEKEGKPAGQLSIAPYLCSRCGATFTDEEAVQSHSDWHMAKDLQDEERGKTTFAETGSATGNRDLKDSSASAKRGRNGRGRAAKAEQGQTKLNFG